MPFAAFGRGWFIGAAAWCVLMLPGCPGHDDAILKQLEELKRELAELKAASANTTVQVEDLQNKMLLLEDQVDSTRLMVSRNRQAQPQEVPDLPVVKVSPREEGAVQGPAGTLTLQTFDEEGNLVDVGSGSAGGGGAGEERREPVVEQEHKRAAFDSRPIELYNKAYGLLQKKKHAEAIAAFEKFLDEYPNHDYSDNALYWMGEAYYDVQDYRSALECFDKLVTIYPDGNKVPDAMLKAALCRCNVGQATEGKERLQQVIREFPGTHAAVVARQKLEAHQCAGTASEDGIPLEE